MMTKEKLGLFVGATVATALMGGVVWTGFILASPFLLLKMASDGAEPEKSAAPASDAKRRRRGRRRR